MGDLPDWVTATNNLSAQLVGGLILPGAQLDQDVSPNDSLIINAFGVGAFGAIILQLDWYTNIITGFFIVSEYFTAAADPVAASQFIVETPVYGTFLRLTNLSAIDVDFTVTGSSRTVAQPKILNSTTPGRVYRLSANVVNLSSYTLLALDNGGNGFASNALTDILAGANVNGALFYTYVDNAGVTRTYFIANLGGAQATQIRLALPQGVGVFTFTASANNAAGIVNLTATPAQL